MEQLDVAHPLRAGLEVLAESYGPRVRIADRANDVELPRADILYSVPSNKHDNYFGSGLVRALNRRLTFRVFK